MAENLQGFFAIGALPFDVKQNQLDDGSGLFNTLYCFFDHPAQCEVCKTKGAGARKGYRRCHICGK